MKKWGIILVYTLVLSFLSGCTVNKERVAVPEWSNNATMYEVNIRQYTKEGTFQAFEEHLPRLKKMGVKILWFMPIYPISREKRLGSLGSYYSISDYKEINPEFGNKEDFKRLVDKCHEMGFKVVLDWVANHTGWDHYWIRKNPDWYTQNAEGQIVYPETWADVADLNFDDKDMKKEMLKAMEYWVKEFDVDGYRCDYAGGVPLEFWEEARTKLNKIKTVYLLAEDDRAMSFMKYAFNSNYGWKLYHDLNSIAKGNKSPGTLLSYFKNTLKNYPTATYPQHFIDNHDENSWNGTVEERLGDSKHAMLSLIFTVPGMPLVYSGQEVNLNKRLEFFEKDEIIWENFTNEDLLTKLIHLKLENKALWNGDAGGEMEFLTTSDERVLSYTRVKEDDKVVVILNLSDKEREFSVTMKEEFEGNNVMTSEKMILSNGMNTINLGPWEYIILSN